MSVTVMFASTAVHASVVVHAKPASRHCTSTSRTGAKPSKYNRTPNRAGPWRVPLDPCNTEAGGAHKVPYANCAYWAAEKRPDVWVHAVWKFGYPRFHGGAWNIERDAHKAGYRISHHPKVGDLALWPPNARMGFSSTGSASNGSKQIYVASPGGHVAYVEKVGMHGQIKISTMGWLTLSGGDDGGYTVTFIYNKDRSFFVHHRPHH